MSWNYRIIQYLDESGYGLHEVYYDDDGVPWAMTEEPCKFVSDDEEGPTAIFEALLTARVHSRQQLVLQEPFEWPGKHPADKVETERLEPKP